MGYACKCMIVGLLASLVVLSGSVVAEDDEEVSEIRVWVGVSVDDQLYDTCTVYTHTTNISTVVNHTSCHSPHNPINGHYTSEADGDSYNDGDTVTYHCDRGHQLVGESVRTCNGTSTEWQPQEPYCQPEYFGRLQISLKGIEDKVTAIEKRIIVVENDTSAIGDRMSTTEERVSSIMNSNVEDRLSTLEVAKAAEHTALKELSEKISSNTWKIVGLCDRLKEENGEMVSQAFRIPGSQYSAQTKIKWNTRLNELVFELSFKENGYQNVLDIKEYPSVAYVIVDQSEAKVKRDLTVLGDYYLFAPTMMFNSFGYGHGTKLSKVKQESNRFCVNYVTVIKTLIEAPEQAIVQSIDGKLSWTIDNFSVRRNNEIEQWQEFQLSEPFYSGKPGYKMRLIVYLNGDGQFLGQGVTIGMRLLKGRWDKVLPDTMSFKTSLTVEDNSLNRIKNHITLNPVAKAGKRRGYYIGLIRHDRIVENVHLIDDSISITVEVKIS